MDQEVTFGPSGVILKGEDRHRKGRSDNRGRRSKGRKGRRTKEMLRIARERMDLLVDHAIVNARSGNMQKADRYIGLARAIGMRYNVRMRHHQRSMLCRRCKGFLLPSRTQSVRIRRGRTTSRCLRCGDIKRTPLRRKTLDDVVPKKKGPVDEDLDEP